MLKTTSGLTIIIRQEMPDDHIEVNELVDTAFTTVHPDADDVADYLIEVRKKDTYIPELAFVAALPGGRIVGQVTLYKTDIVTETGRITQLVLSPICVHPDFFRKGIAREMIIYALSKAKETGYIAVFLQGNPRFYEKFGFEPACKYGIYHEKDADRNAEYFMVHVLTPGGLDGISGVTDYE